MAKKKQVVERNIADLINSGEIKNLADINWRKETDNWENNTAEKIIEKINDKTLKPAVIDVMLSEWRYNRSEWVTNIGFDMGFCDFLEGLKRHIQNYDYFNIETIKNRQTKELNQIKKGVEYLRKKVCVLPKELDNAKAILQKVIQAGLCDNNYLWKGTIQLLAYFADKTSHYFNLTQRTDKDGNIITLWKPLESLFEYEGVRYRNSCRCI